MTAIAVTPAQVALVHPKKTSQNIRSYIASVAITKGQAVYITTTGKAALCDANGSGTKQFRGIALKSVDAGSAVDVLHDGELYGFGVSALNVDALIYASNTPGGLDTAAGSTTIAAGRVVALTDSPTLTKVLRVFTRWEADWT